MSKAISVNKKQRPPIRPRRERFTFDEIEGLSFVEDNVILSAFVASLSAMFPPGEQSFIDSVRHYKDQINEPELMAQVRAFVGQEVQHSLQHAALNKALDRLGFSATRLEKHLEMHIEKTNARLLPAVVLASTVGMEHITAIMAEYFLTYPALLNAAPPSVRDLIRWHAVEEIEHKAVAFDVYEACVGDRELLHRVYRYVAAEFVVRLVCYQVALLFWSRKVPSFREIKGAYKRFFSGQGLLPSIRKPFMDFFREGFHPWDHDNRDLIQLWVDEHSKMAA